MADRRIVRHGGCPSLNQTLRAPPGDLLIDARRRNEARRRAAGLSFSLGLLVALAAALAWTPAARADGRAILTPASGFVGTSVRVSATGFGRKRAATVRVGHRRVAAVRTRANGTFRASFKIPAGVRGLVRVVSRSRSRRVVNFFRVATAAGDPGASEIASATGTRLRWAPRRAPVAATIGLRGSRFHSMRRVRITFGDTKVKGTRTGSGGRFSTRVVVPALTVGSHRVRVRAGAKQLTFKFAVTPDPLVLAAGDIACDPKSPGFNGGAGTATGCHMRQTSDVILGAKADAVLALGDNQYEAGTLGNFQASFQPSWGRFKGIIHPAPGNHEYLDQDARGYFDYYGAQAGDRSKGYYSFDIGSWHLIALNSNCTEPNVHCGIGFAQERWLRADLQTHRNRCVLAYWHHPYFSSGQSGNSPTMRDLFNALYEARADLVLVAHDHVYERFAPQTPDGQLDLTNGIRQIVVGTGGRDLHTFKKPAKPNSEVQNADTFGALSLRLRRDSYEWQFLPEAGRAFRDSGSQLCH
jgi:hypothetical protein